MKKEYDIVLDNTYKLILNWDEDLYSVDFDLLRLNGDRYELELEGQVKYTECYDFGYAKEIMIHGCSRKDLEIFTIIYDKAMEILDE